MDADSIPKSLADYLTILFYAAGFPVRRVERECFYWEYGDCERSLRVIFTETRVKGLWYVGVKYTKVLWGYRCTVFVRGHFNEWEPSRDADLFDVCADRIREIQDLVIRVRESGLADVYFRRDRINIVFDWRVATVEYENALEPMNVYHIVQGTRLSHEQLTLFEGCNYEGVRS